MTPIITHYGYQDGSGQYYIGIDAEKCDGCNRCVEDCLQGTLELVTVMVDLEDKVVAGVTDEHRKKLRYTCAPCKRGEEAPCVLACEKAAITHTWSPLGGVGPLSDTETR